MVLLLAGCGAGSNLNIVSPSASEDEVRKRAQMVPVEKRSEGKDETRAPEKPAEKSPSAGKEKPSPSPASPDVSVGRAQAKEMKPAEESPTKGICCQEALINLLERKGIITKKELMEEMKRLEQGAK